MQQVDVRQCAQRLGPAGEPVTGLQQRCVIAAAVEAGQHGGRREPRGEGIQHRAFRAQRGNQQLAHTQAGAMPGIVMEIRRADHEGTGAGTAGQPGGLGIEEQQVGRSHTVVRATGKPQ